MKRFAKSASALAFAGVVALGATPVANAAVTFKEGGWEGNCSYAEVTINDYNANVAKAVEAATTPEKVAEANALEAELKAKINKKVKDINQFNPGACKFNEGKIEGDLTKPDDEKAVVAEKITLTDDLKRCVSKETQDEIVAFNADEARTQATRDKLTAQANTEAQAKCGGPGLGGILAAAGLLGAAALGSSALGSSQGGAPAADKPAAPAAPAADKPAAPAAPEKGVNPNAPQKGMAPEKGMAPGASKGTPAAEKGATKDANRGVLASTGSNTAVTAIAALMVLAAAGAGVFALRRKFA